MDNFSGIDGIDDSAKGLVNDHITKARESMARGQDFDIALYATTHDVIAFLIPDSLRAIAGEQSHEQVAGVLNRALTVIKCWTQEVIAEFEVDEDYWEGQGEGLKVMFAGFIDYQLKASKGQRMIWWTGKRFISETDLG